MIDTLAAAALCGVPAARIMAGDDVEHALWVSVTERAVARQNQLIQALASHVGNEVARRLG